MKSIAVAIAVAAGVGWLAWPYFSAYSIGQAINEGDTVALERRVSWPSVQQGIKNDLNAVLHALKNNQQPDRAEPFGGLVSALGPVMINAIVDAYMTPSGLATLLRERKLGWQELGGVKGPGEKQRLQIDNVKYAFFAGPTSFLLVLGDRETSDDKRLEVMMQFQDFGWKVTRVFLPVKKIIADQKEAATELSQSDLFKAAMGEVVKKPSTPAEPAQGKSSEADRANLEYIDKVRLYDLQARYIDDFLDRKIPGVRFKLKNEGDKTLKRVEVTVYFKDRSGNVITEETYKPVLVTAFNIFGDNKPLKPGYIWQNGSGEFYKTKSVPSEWAEGRAEAKVTRVEIDDQGGTEEKINQQVKVEESVPPTKPASEEPFEVLLRRKTFAESQILIDVSFKNVTDKPILAFDGVLMFTDLLDNEIFKSNIEIKNRVGAGQMFVWPLSITYFQVHERLRNEPQENVKLCAQENRLF